MIQQYNQSMALQRRRGSPETSVGSRINPTDNTHNNRAIIIFNTKLLIKHNFVRKWPVTKNTSVQIFRGRSEIFGPGRSK